jgi:type I restriction enzyme S subunit
MAKRKLIDICDIQYGYPFDSSKFSATPDEGMPLIRIRDVMKGYTETYYRGDYPKEYIIHKGDYLVGMDGEFNIAAWQGEDALLNQRVCKVESSCEDVSTSFLYRFLKIELKKIEEDTPFATVKHLSAKRLNQISLNIPSLSEQKRIVAELDLLTDVIDKQKQQLKELDTLAQSIFYDMFGDPVANEKGWELKCLSNMIRVKGRVGWKGYKKEDLRESGPLAIGGGHLAEDGSLDLSSPIYLSREKYEESPEIKIEIGDLILVQRGTIGRIGLVKSFIGEATINPCVLILRPITINGVYALYFFLNKEMQKYLKTLIRGVAQPMITQQQVNAIPVPVPPIALQQTFAKKIEAIEKQKEMINQSIEETQKLFDYTMDKYFG